MPVPEPQAGDRVRDSLSGAGRLADLAGWLVRWRGEQITGIRHPRIAVFAATHGHVPDSLARTRSQIQGIVDGTTLLNRLCEGLNTDLRLYEMDLDTPTADMTTGPAMTEEACARAMAYGMMAVEAGVDLLCPGSLGIGQETAALAMIEALGGQDIPDRTVQKALAANPAALQDPFGALRCLGGYEIAAMAGAILAARMGRIPVLLDGLATFSAALVLEKACAGATQHCRMAQPMAPSLSSLLPMDFVMDAGLADGSGAVAAIPLVRMAAAIVIRAS